MLTQCLTFLSSLCYLECNMEKWECWAKETIDRTEIWITNHVHANLTTAVRLIYYARYMFRLFDTIKVIVMKYIPGCWYVLSPTRKETSSEACQGLARFQQYRDASCHLVIFFLQGKAPKEIQTILTEILACFLPGRAKDLSAPLYRWHLMLMTFTKVVRFR